MVDFKLSIGARLQWRQPEAFRRFYELALPAADGNGATVGSLRFEGATMATADLGGHRWTFRKTGFWSPKTIVTETASGTEVATFFPHWNGSGELVFGSGRRFHLKSLAFWKGEWAFETDNGTPVVTLHGPGGIVRHRGESEVRAAGIPETALLLPLIWYTRLLMQQDEAATVALIACG